MNVTWPSRNRMLLVKATAPSLDPMYLAHYAAGMDDELRIRLLGGFGIEGQEASSIGRRKSRTLLKILALARGRPVSADRIADALWGDEPPADPRAQVAVLVSRLRRALGADRLSRHDDGYALEVDWIDVVELEARCREAAARLEQGAPGPARAAARAALDLARGPLLPDEDGDWVASERATADRTVARVRLVGAEAALAAGDPADAGSLAEAALSADPYDEVALRLLMRAHVDAGRHAAALAAYERVRATLADELGVDPSPETAELHTSILQRQPVVPAPVTLPEPPVGREVEWKRLDDAAGATVVEGEAGIGKTTLVSEWAASARAGGAVVLWGRCDELGRALPLQPVLDALDAHLSGVGDEAADEILGPDADMVGPLVGRRLRGTPAAATTLADAEAARAVLYAALISAVQRAASGATRAILVVEDIHLAAPGTLEWLQLAARRARGLRIVCTSRPPAPGVFTAERIQLGPLDLAATQRLVGRDRAQALHERSGGHPLFLTELAAAPDEALPASIRDAVAARTDVLGPRAAATLRTASILGQVVDLDLLAAVLRLPASDLLEDLEAGARARLLTERGASFVFRHELVREAIEASTTASRRALTHRDAARMLAARSHQDALGVAWHARLGGDSRLAAASLVEAADLAAARYDLAEAARHLSDSITLDDGIPARLARARVRLARWEIRAAMDDAERAIAMGAGAEGFELAGWVAYYARDYPAARAYADEGVRRAADPSLRGSCLSLAARVRHSRGEMEDASLLLEEAVEIATSAGRELSHVWLGAVRAHQGRFSDALATLSRASVARERSAHPFAELHGLFTRVYALGALGRIQDAFATLEELDRAVVQRGLQQDRWGAVTANMRGWLLRNLGSGEEADRHTSLAIEQPDTPPNAEPRYVGHLDLADGRLAVGDPQSAATILDSIAEIMQWEGTMAWRQRHRYRLLRARVALAAGDREGAREQALAVAEDAAKVGSHRHALFGRLFAAAAGRRADPESVAADLDALDRAAALEAWWITAELASAYGVEGWWGRAERHVDRLAAAAAAHAGALRTEARRRFGVLGR